VEVPVWERQVFHLGCDIFDTFNVLRVIDNEINAGEMLDIRTLQADHVEQISGAASYVANLFTDYVGDDPFDAGIRIVGMSVDARMMTIKLLVFRFRQKGCVGAELGEIGNMTAPGELGDAEKCL